MNLLQDIITYVRRIIKTPSNSVISDALIIDYINRFWLMDVDARIQLFDLKSKYQFQTQPGVDQYNMPLYDIQTELGNQAISFYPVYQGFTGTAWINGTPVGFSTQKNDFYGYWNVMQNQQSVAIGDGVTTTFQINMPILPNGSNPINPPFSALLRGHVDITGIINTNLNVDPPLVTTFNTSIPVTSVDSKVFITSLSVTGENIIVADSGQFLSSSINHGLLMKPGNAPYGNSSLGSYSIAENTVNYLTGVANVTFPVPPAAGANINAQCVFYQTGLPREILFYNNVLTLRVPPAQQYLVELDAYLSPCAFLSTSQAIPFGYMAEYIARGAARKILSDTGDVEQFSFYEPLFKEQEMLVWKRSQRQFTSTRTQTLYSMGNPGSSDLGGWGTNI